MDHKMKLGYHRTLTMRVDTLNVDGGVVYWREQAFGTGEHIWRDYSRHPVADWMARDLEELFQKEVPQDRFPMTVTSMITGMGFMDRLRVLFGGTITCTSKTEFDFPLPADLVSTSDFEVPKLIKRTPPISESDGCAVQSVAP